MWAERIIRSVEQLRIRSKEKERHCYSIKIKNSNKIFLLPPKKLYALSNRFADANKRFAAATLR